MPETNLFEDKLRHAMDDFRINPSPEVWNNVLSQNKRDRKRRFIFWFLPLLLLPCIGYFVWTTGGSSVEQQVIANRQAATKEKVTTKPGLTIKAREQAKATSPGISTNETNTINPVAPAQTRKVENKKTLIAFNEKSPRVVEARKITANTTVAIPSTGNSTAEVVDLSTTATYTAETPTITQAAEDTITTSPAIIEDAVKETKEETTQEAKQVKPVKPNLKKLSFGVAAGGAVTGLSGVSGSSETLQYNPAGNPPFNGAVAHNRITTVLKPAAGFHVALVAKYRLNRRFSLQAGLEYNYLSYSTHTRQVTDYVTIVSFLDTSVTRQITTRQTFHAIGLPVSVTGKLFSYRKNTVDWFVGVQPMYIVGGNAKTTISEASGTVKTSDYSLTGVERFQLMATGGLTVELPIKNRFNLSLSPYGQIGTSRFSGNSQQKGVLYQAGLRLTTWF